MKGRLSALAPLRLRGVAVVGQVASTHARHVAPRSGGEVALVCASVVGLALLECVLEACARRHRSKVWRAMERVGRTLVAVATLVRGASSSSSSGFAAVGRAVSSAYVYLRWSSLVVKALVPGQHRSLVSNAKILPIAASYVRAKRRIGSAARGAADRDRLWDAQHEWAAERARRLTRDLGGFYLKVGQITGAAAQMMPPAWVRALSETMDDAAPVPFDRVRRIVERDLGRPLEEAFVSFDPEPAATASIAQVHRATVMTSTGVLKRVAVKVGLGRKKVMMRDVAIMTAQAKTLKAAGLDGGLDLPSIMKAYEDIIPEEFDFRLEAAKIDIFASAFAEAKLGALVATPTLVRHLCTERVLVAEWMEGPKLLDVFRGAERAGATPRLPPPQAKRFRSWGALYNALCRAWGCQIFGVGEFHTDPHPGNIVLLRDGRVGLLDFGQTKKLDAGRVATCATCTVAMAEGNVDLLVRAIEGSGDYELSNPSPVAWALISYTYFDTRWTPLAGVNLYDVDRSLLAKDGFEKNSPEAFPLIRLAFLMRGAMAQCGVQDESMVDAWYPYARTRLGRPDPLAAPKTAYRKAKRRLVSSLARALPPSLLEIVAGNTAAKLWVAQRNGPATYAW